MKLTVQLRLSFDINKQNSIWWMEKCLRCFFDFFDPLKMISFDFRMLGWNRRGKKLSVSLLLSRMMTHSTPIRFQSIRCSPPRSRRQFLKLKTLSWSARQAASLSQNRTTAWYTSHWTKILPGRLRTTWKLCNATDTSFHFHYFLFIFHLRIAFYQCNAWHHLHRFSLQIHLKLKRTENYKVFAHILNNSKGQEFQLKVFLFCFVWNFSCMRNGLVLFYSIDKECLANIEGYSPWSCCFDYVLGKVKLNKFKSSNVFFIDMAH